MNKYKAKALNKKYKIIWETNFSGGKIIFDTLVVILKTKHF